MLATPSVALPGDDAHWAYEMKWDGMRALVGVERGDGVGDLAGRQRRHRPASPSSPASGAALGDVDVLLDGEVVALDDAGIPSFERLQPRMQAGSAAAVRQRAADQPVAYMVFDVLWIDGHSTCELPYTDRRTLLERLALAGDAWQTPPSTAGGGAAVLATSVRLGSKAWWPSGSTATTCPASGPTPGAR